jgi:hypothetical protein
MFIANIVYKVKGALARVGVFDVKNYNTKNTPTIQRGCFKQ